MKPRRALSHWPKMACLGDQSLVTPNSGRETSFCPFGKLKFPRNWGCPNAHKVQQFSASHSSVDEALHRVFFIQGKEKRMTSINELLLGRKASTAGTKIR